MMGQFSKAVVVALLVGQLVAPTSLVAIDQNRRVLVGDTSAKSRLTGSMGDQDENPELREAQEEINSLIEEIKEADEHQAPEDIPDPYHLSQQYLLLMRKDGNRADRYHLVGGSAGGLPSVITRPDKVRAIEFDGYLAFRYKSAVHVVESIRPLAMVSDTELLVVIDEQGDVYAVDMSFARGEALFKSPVPVHKTLMSIPVTGSSLQLSFATRGLAPFNHIKTASGVVEKISDQRRFTAGDLIVWQKIGDRRVLIEVISRDFVVTEINNGNYFLASLIYEIRGDKPSEIARAIKVEEINGQQPRDNRSHIENTSEQAKQIMQSIDAKRIEKMVLRDVAINTYRDSFTYSDWQRDYLMLKHQARVVIEELEESVNKKYKIIKDLTDQQKLDDLKEQLRKGDLSSSWITLSESRVEDLRDMIIDRITVLKALKTPEANAKIDELQEILASYDYRRLWDNPQLLVDVGTTEASPFRLKVERIRYRYFNSDNLLNIAGIIGGVGTIGATLYASAWLLKSGFTLRSHLIPDPLRKPKLPQRSEPLVGAGYNYVRDRYRRYIIWATIAGLALIPTVAIVSHLGARTTGEDWDFRKQLALVGMRTYSTLALPFWHYFSRWTGQTTLMPAMAARVSPFEAVDGNSAIGQSLGLKDGESIRVGFRNPFLADKEDAEGLRRRAIAVLQQQKTRAQAIGWEMAANIMWGDYLFGKKIEEVDRDALIIELQKDDFKRKWKKLAVNLEQQIYQLYKSGVYQDLRLVTTDNAYTYLKKVTPESLLIDTEENFVNELKAGAGKLVAETGRLLATASVDDFTYLQTADPDDFIASELWIGFMIDFVSVVVWESIYGARSKVFHPKVNDPKTGGGIGHLTATNRFPYWGGEHTEMLLGQIYAHQVAAQGRYSLIFQKLKRVQATNYQPHEGTVLKGRDNPQSFWGGLAGLSRDAVDLRNLDVGSKYAKSLFVGITMFQAGFLYNLVARSLFAGVRLKSLIPQHLFNFSFGIWGFAWPWIYYYSARQLGETKLEVRNGMFDEAKVRMAMHDPQQRQEGYQAMVATYRQFYGQPPPILVAEIKQVEDSLQIAQDERLPAKAMLPYLGLLVTLSASESLVEKRRIYRRIIDHIDNATDYQPTDSDLEQMVMFAMLNPAFPDKIGASVSFVGILTGAIVTTWLGSVFHRKSFDKSSIRSVAPFIVGGTALYAGTWMLLKKEHSRKIIDFVREKILGYPEREHEEY